MANTVFADAQMYHDRKKENGKKFIEYLVVNECARNCNRIEWHFLQGLVTQKKPEM